MTTTLEAIRYTRGTLTILDQLRLPHHSIYVPISSPSDAWTAIKTMVTRGAPAIAIVAALSLAVELIHLPPFASAEEAREHIVSQLDYLVTSRPTAVNLSDAARKLRAVVEKAEEPVKAYIEAAEHMLEDDVADNKAIGQHGAEWLTKDLADGEKISVLTHCNTGSLATAGYGTALGIIRSLHVLGRLEHAYCTETRPYNQGSRLTAYELAHDLPTGMATLITDSMAASLMRSRKIAAVIVGADRVARNGDTANKIGTYQLAIVARWHGVKMVVAAPTTSVDLQTADGEGIEIEMRPGREVLVVKGPVVKDGSGEEVEVETEKVETIVPGVAGGVGVYNPSFDVTPGELVDAIVTEKGVAVKDGAGAFALERFF